MLKALGLAGFMLSDALLLVKESPIPDSWRTKVMYLADSASEMTDTFMGRASRYLSNGFAQIFPEKGLPVLQFPYQYFALKDIFDKALEMAELIWRFWKSDNTFILPRAARLLTSLTNSADIGARHKCKIIRRSSSSTSKKIS